MDDSTARITIYLEKAFETLKAVTGERVHLKTQTSSAVLLSALNTKCIKNKVILRNLQSVSVRLNTSVSCDVLPFSLVNFAISVSIQN